MPLAEQEAAALLARFDIIETRVELADRTLSLLRPRSADDLLDEEEFERDERIPYWAEIWPSSQVLARRLAKEAGCGRRLLELGCGAGLCCAAALVAGFDVVGTDYYTDALSFVQLNAARNGLPEPQTRLVDWRAYPDDLTGFEVVAAADVLYEKPYAAMVAAAFARSLAPGGLGLMADPGRQRAIDFPEECDKLGLDIRSTDHIPFKSPEHSVTIDLYEIRWR